MKFTGSGGDFELKSWVPNSDKKQKEIRTNSRSEIQNTKLEIVCFFVNFGVY